MKRGRNIRKKSKSGSGRTLKLRVSKNAMERGTKALIDDARELNLPFSFLKVSEDEGVTNLHEADEQMDPAELIDDLDNSTALKLRRKLWLSQNQQQSTHPPSEE